MMNDLKRHFEPILASVTSAGTALGLDQVNAVLSCLVGLATLAWWLRLWIKNPSLPPPSAPPSNPPENKSRLPLALALCGLAAFLPGCVLGTQHKNIVSITETTIGLKIEESADNRPTLKIGYNRARFTVVPTVRSTNEFIWTPDVVDSFSADNNSVGQSLDEDFATGKLGVQSISTNSIGQLRYRKVNHGTNAPAK
jgi:hypothetical protein